MQDTHDGQPNELTAEITISGFENAEEITATLSGLGSAEILHKGEPKRLGPNVTSPTLTHQRNTWILKSQESGSSEIETHLRTLIDLVWPLRSEISKLGENYEVGLSVYGYVYRPHVGVNLDPRTLERIAFLKATLDIDIYSLDGD